MKLKPYIEKLNSSKKFKDFIKKNPDAYFSAGFFVLDFETKKNIHQIDYYLPKEKKIVTFEIDKGIEMKKSETANDQIPKKIFGGVETDLDILKGLVEDEMKNHTITHQLQKIIAILQNIDGKLEWSLNCITSDMGVIKVHVDDKTHSILKFDPINLFDVVRKISPSQ